MFATRPHSKQHYNDTIEVSTCRRKLTQELLGWILTAITCIWNIQL